MQMKKQDKKPQGQISEEKIGKPPKKIIQNNDSKDNIKSQKQEKNTRIL